MLKLVKKISWKNIKKRSNNVKAMVLRKYGK